MITRRIIIFLSLSVINSDDPCTSNTSPQSLQDCLNTATTYYNSICCLRRMKYSNGDQLSCYPVNRANGTTTVSFYYNSVRGVLTCSSKVKTINFLIIVIAIIFLLH